MESWTRPQDASCHQPLIRKIHMAGISVLIAMLLTGSVFAAEFTVASAVDEIGKMKAMLEKDTVEGAKEFIGRYAEPGEADNMRKEGGIDKIAREFIAQGRNRKLDGVLKSLDLDSAKLRGKDKTVVFALKDDGKDVLVMSFVDGSWYIRN